jgi:hypothetical protein
VHAQALQTQPLPEPGARTDKPAEKAAPAPTRPRITLKPKARPGAGIGDDVPGGGPPASESSKGGTPGTPSGSFTGQGARP